MDIPFVVSVLLASTKQFTVRLVDVSSKLDFSSPGKYPVFNGLMFFLFMAVSCLSKPSRLRTSQIAFIKTEDFSEHLNRPSTKPTQEHKTPMKKLIIIPLSSKG